MCGDGDGASGPDRVPHAVFVEDVRVGGGGVGNGELPKEQFFEEALWMIPTDASRSPLSGRSPAARIAGSMPTK